MTETNAQLLQAALQGDEQALAAVSRDPQAVRELQALRAARPWVEAVAADAARLAATSTSPRWRESLLHKLQAWLRPAVLVPAASLAVVVLLARFHTPDPATVAQPASQAMTEQATSQEGIPQGLSAPARDALFVSDFDRPASASSRHPSPGHADQLFDGNFEKNS